MASFGTAQGRSTTTVRDDLATTITQSSVRDNLIQASPRATKIGYLGLPKWDHSENFSYLMRSAGIEPYVIPESLYSDAYGRAHRQPSWGPVQSLLRRSKRIRDQLFGTSDRGYLESALKTIDDNDLKCIVAYWGTQPLGDIIALKRHRPAIKIVLNVLCHPTALSAAKIAAQNWYFRRAVGSCDALIASSEVMRRYLLDNVVRRQSVPVVVSPPYFSRAYLPKSRLPSCGRFPNVVFLGRVDWRKAQPTDNALPFLRTLMEHGVHVYYHHASESAIEHSNAHTFPYKALIEATTFVTQFDVSLVMYNLDECQRTDRFRVTVPDRVIASVIAGLPVAIPASGYDACGEYLRDYRAVISFSSPEELARRLRDRDAVEHLKQLALVDSQRYVGEARIGELFEALAGATGIGEGGQP